MKLGAEVRHLMDQIRLAGWRARAERDFKLLQDAAPKFGEMEKIFIRILPLTGPELDKRRVAELQAAAKSYEGGVASLIAASTALTDVGARRAKVAGDLAKHSGDIVAVGLARTTGIAKESAFKLDAASMTTVIASELPP